jgi:hypothetical protein
MYSNTKTSGTTLTACSAAAMSLLRTFLGVIALPSSRSMKSQIESWAASILVKIQIITANLDPEVLQWPCGCLIATLLWLYVMTRTFWSVGSGGSAALRG